MALVTDSGISRATVSPTCPYAVSLLATQLTAAASTSATGSLANLHRSHDVAAYSDGNLGPWLGDGFALLLLVGAHVLIRSHAVTLKKLRLRPCRPRSALSPSRCVFFHRQQSLSSIRPPRPAYINAVGVEMMMDPWYDGLLAPPLGLGAGTLGD